MKKLRVALLLFIIALSLPLSYVLTRTYSGLRQEEISRLRFFAAALFDAMEVELAELILREEERPVDTYGSPNASGEPDIIGKGNDSTTFDKGPLNTLPVEPWLRGYLQNQPDGSFQTPLAGGAPDASERRRELAGFNTHFNAIRYQAPLSVQVPEPQAPVQMEMEATKEKAYSDSLWYQTSPSKARSALEGKKVRLEEITASQARKVTRPLAKKSAPSKAGPAPSPEPLVQSPQRVASAVRQEAVAETEEEAEMPHTGVSNKLEAPADEATIAEDNREEAQSDPSDRQQVEVAPFQSLLLDDGHAFIFRRILIQGKTYRQGFVIDLAAFSQHLLATHFADQPLARFTQLQLWTQKGPSLQLQGTLGRGGDSVSLEMEHQLPRPFSFLRARLVCGEIPPSSARAPLRLTLMALAAVLLLGLFAIYRSVNAQVSLAHRRSQFASAVTHELKTPLTTIRMYVEMLEQGMAGDPQRQQRYFDVLGTETDRLGRLINNVLELSRLEKQQRPLNYGYGDLSDVVEKVAATLGPQLDTAGFDFQVENRLRGPFAYDAEVLVQVLVNLIENSIKFGSGSERKEIRLTIESHRGSVNLAVSDTGPGIPRSDLKRIFEDFYRAEDEMTRTTSGTGIGLALVKRFARAMDGDVTAANNPRGGCTITLSIPADTGKDHTP